MKVEPLTSNAALAHHPFAPDGFDPSDMLGWSPASSSRSLPHLRLPPSQTSFLFSKKPKMLPPLPQPLEMGGLTKAGDIGVAFNPDWGLAGGLTPYQDPSRPGPGCSENGTGSPTDPADFESYMEILKQGSAGSLRAAAAARMLRQEAQRASLLARGAMGALLAAADGPDRLGSNGMAYKPVRSMGLDVMEKGAASSGLSGLMGQFGSIGSTAMGALGSFLDAGSTSADHDGGAEGAALAVPAIGPSHPRLEPTSFILKAVGGMILGGLKGLLGGLGNTNIRTPRGQEAMAAPDDEPRVEGLVFDYRNYRNTPQSQQLPDAVAARESAQTPNKPGLGDPFAPGGGGLMGMLKGAAGSLGFIQVAVTGAAPGLTPGMQLDQCRWFL